MAYIMGIKDTQKVFDGLWTEMPKLPETEDCLQCIVEKKRSYKRKDEVINFTEVVVLVYNPHHECWDDSDGDDYNCDLNDAVRWMPFPNKLKD